VNDILLMALIAQRRVGNRPGGSNLAPLNEGQSHIHY
jgi:hypothetical protein